MSGQPPYPPFAGGYGLPPSSAPAYSSTPLLSTQPLGTPGGAPIPAPGAAYDPYAAYAQPGAGAGMYPPPPNPMAPQQQQPPARMGYPAAAGYGQPPRPASALSIDGQQLNGHPHALGAPQRVGTPSYAPSPILTGAGLGAAPAGSASPALAHHAPPTPTAGSLALGGQPSPQQATGAQGAAAGLPKARSAMACVLCRRQKMKCEGPDKAPCRRCKAAQVECVFEAPPAAPPRPRGGGVTEAWVESRIGQVEDRMAALEESAGSSQALVLHQQQQHQQQQNAASAATLSEHERRIAALEQQLYALQLQAARTAHAPVQPPSLYPAASTSTGTNPGPDAYGFATGGSLGRFDEPTTSTLKHEADGGDDLNGSAGAGADAADDHREKRWKGDPLASGLSSAEPDFISRGVVTEEEALMCFESYHLTFAYSHTSLAPPQSHLSFEETRRRSPFFLATVISIGARSLSRFDTFHAAYREAMRLAHATFLPYADGDEDLVGLDPSSPPSALVPFVPFGAPGSDAVDAPPRRLSTLALKALMLLALYHSMPELLVHVFMLGYRFVLPTALLEFEKLSEEDKAGEQGRVLLNRGRVFLTGYLWLAFYSYCRGQQGFFDQPIEMLRHQLDIIRRSNYAEQPTDHVIRVNLEECLILLNAFKQLGPGMRHYRSAIQQTNLDDHAEVYRLVGEAIDKLVEWDSKYHENMDILSQWGDSQELKSKVPFAHGRQCLLMYIFRDLPVSSLDRDNPKTREFALMGMESASMILRWGVESRIWMPFSIVGNYVHHVNIPTALYLYSTCAHLYPSLADFSTLRPLLHRLVKQCDVTITHAGATPREIARARRTKMEVLELDRFAFEQAGDDVPSAPAGPVPGGGGGGAGGAADDAGLFGHEITASLDSLRLELNLWAKPLRGFEEDL
ncbi:hypothetical protein JCM10207_002488 [Rhodosporidiobolus poonsookiae]